MHDIKADKIQVNSLESLEEAQIVSNNKLAYTESYTDFEDQELVTKVWVLSQIGSISVGTTEYTEADLETVNPGDPVEDQIHYLPLDTISKVAEIKYKITGETKTHRLGLNSVEEDSDWTPAKRIYFPSNSPQTITITTI
jgi:hypothetical protein